MEIRKPAFPTEFLTGAQIIENRDRSTGSRPEQRTDNSISPMIAPTMGQILRTFT